MSAGSCCFFAIVYLVEGIGQARVGIIYQPLTHYLKETGWTALQVAAYFAVLNFPWVIKPVFGLVSDFVPLFGYRRKSYLIIASLCAVGGYAVIARQADPAAFALPLLLTAYAMATASTLCGALLAENGQAFRLSSSFVSQQWLWFYIAIMACSFAGGALIEALPALSALQIAAAIAAVAPIAVVLASLFLLDEKKVGASGPEMRRTFQSLVAASRSAQALHRRPVPVSLFLRARLRHAALLLHDRRAQILAELHRHPGRDRLGRLDRRRPGASLPAARHELEGAAHPQHRAGDVSVASFLLLADPVTAAIVNFANGVAMMIATIASLTLAADYCPKRAEGFAFAGLMSIMNLRGNLLQHRRRLALRPRVRWASGTAHHRLRRLDGIRAGAGSPAAPRRQRQSLGHWNWPHSSG